LYNHARSLGSGDQDSFIARQHVYIDIDIELLTVIVHRLSNAGHSAVVLPCHVTPLSDGLATPQRELTRS